MTFASAGLPACVFAWLFDLICGVWYIQDVCEIEGHRKECIRVRPGQNRWKRLGYLL